jgi:hypothetical protein
MFSGGERSRRGKQRGELTYWRKSLRPAIFAHGLQDALGGIAMFLSKV